MVMLWGLPPLILIIGVLAAAAIVRQAGELTAGLRDELTRLGEIQAAVAEVRAESTHAHHHVEVLRRR